MHKLVGIHGLSNRAQQDAVAEVIQENHGHFHYRMSALRDQILGHVLQSLGYSTRRINVLFRQPLLDAVIPELGVDLKNLTSTLETSWGIERVGYDFWIKCATTYIQALQDEGMPVIVTDLSTVRQIEALLSLGAAVFCIPTTIMQPPLIEPGIHLVPSSDPDVLVSRIETELAISIADGSHAILQGRKRA